MFRSGIESRKSWLAGARDSRLYTYSSLKVLMHGLESGLIPNEAQIDPLINHFYGRIKKTLEPQDHKFMIRVSERCESL